MSNSDNNTVNEDLQKTLRKLNSCITLTSVAASASGNASPNSSEEDEESRESSRSPEGSSDKEDSDDRANSIVKDWSKRCISISFSKKKSNSEQDGVKSPGNEETLSKESVPKSNQETSSSSGVNPFKCSFCEKVFTTQNELIRHILTCKRLGGSISFSNNSPKNTSESEEESSEEESDTDRTIAALKAKSSITATVSSSNTIASNLKLQKESLAAIGNLPKGISISTSCNISKKSVLQTEEKSTESEAAKQPNRQTPLSPPDSEDQSSISSESSTEDCTGKPQYRQYKNNKKAPPAKKTAISKEIPEAVVPRVAKKVGRKRKKSFEFIGFNNYSKDPAEQTLITKKRSGVGRKSTGALKPSPDRPCLPCNIEDIGSLSDFHRHHSKHITTPSVRLKRLRKYKNSSGENSGELGSEIETQTLLERNNSTSTDNLEQDLPPPVSGISSIDGSPGSSSSSNSGSLKLTFKISKVEEPGGLKKIKTISILNSEDMQESLDRQGDDTSMAVDQSNILFPESIDNSIMTGDAGEKTSVTESPFSADPNTTFSNPVPPQAPPSAYEPQFESFTGDWLNEYESGERIAAAMTGAAPPTDNGNNMLAGGHPQDAMYNTNQPLPPDGGNPQGSFEQLCLNDSYNQNQSSNALNGGQAHHLPYNNAQSGDLFSDLNYLGNAERQVNSIGQPNEYMNGSNPSTPNSLSSHPSPGDSFRSLATSPQGTASPMSPNDSTLMPNAANGPTPPLSQAVESPTEVTAPRLTIANNLMPTTTASLTPLIGVYNQQTWPQANSSPTNFSQTYISKSMGPPSTMTSSIPGLPAGYRPSPRPRVRGRPPLMEGLNRTMMRGPGRPPGPNSLNGSRGGMVARGSPNIFSGSGSRMSLPQKRPLSGSPNVSPSKAMRREDINVPSRQKDNDCQIIAVANRNEGMPVISNVQGNSREDRSRPSVASGLDSTIHLSDSITLSVRPNTTKEVGTPSKGGDAGVVANLLASRGITVTPAAGEKEMGSNIREERRLPSASDLNLSSAISVHPPSRDRDGFAVPQPPQNRTVVNDNADRPSRPPTVDLTQEVSSHGAQATRLQCSQCSRSFPTASMLADHAKVHQTQQQSRMPYKCHLCNAGFSAQKGQQTHYQQFHQLQLSAGDLAIPIVDVRNPVTQRKMQQLGVRAFLPLTNLQNRGAGGVVGIPILTLENINNGQMSLQQWGITDVMSLGPPKTFNSPRSPMGPSNLRMQRPPVPRSQ